MAILEQLDKRLPFSIPTPSLIFDLLPTADINAIRPVAVGLKISVVPVPNPSPFTGNPTFQHETFVQLAQATYLLSRVIDHIYEGPNATESPCRAGRLDESLQHYSMSLLHDGGSEGGMQCWPYSICMRYEERLSKEMSSTDLRAVQCLNLIVLNWLQNVLV